MRFRNRNDSVMETLEARKLLATATAIFGEFHGVIVPATNSPSGAAASRVVLDLQPTGDGDRVIGRLSTGTLSAVNLAGTQSDGRLALSLSNASRRLSSLSISAVENDARNFRGTFSQTLSGRTTRGNIRLNFIKATSPLSTPTPVFGNGSAGGFGTTRITIPTDTTTTGSTGTGSTKADVVGANGTLTGPGIAIGEPGVAMGEAGVAMGEAGVAMAQPGVAMADFFSGFEGAGTVIDPLAP